MRIEFHARPPRRRENAAPIGIAAGERCFHQRRSRDRFGDSAAPRLRFLRRALRFRSRAARLRRRRRSAAPASGKHLQAQRQMRGAPCCSPRLTERRRLRWPERAECRWSKCRRRSLMELKVREVTSRSVFCRSAGAMAASVTTNASVVAIFGMNHARAFGAADNMHRACRPS